MAAPLNCKEGDLAIIYNNYLPENTGLLVKVISIYPFPMNNGMNFDKNIGFIWLVKTVSENSRIRYLYRRNNIVTSEQFLFEGPIADKNLKPIHGSSKNHKRHRIEENAHHLMTH
jgi:hypothetical protein